MLMEACKCNKSANRNVRRSDNYTSINWTELVYDTRAGYLTNEEEEKKHESDEYQDTIVNVVEVSQGE